MPRIGLDKLKAILVEDSEGICARLEATLAEAVAAYKDPWKEAYAPVTPNQFASLLPVLQ